VETFTYAKHMTYTWGFLGASGIAESMARDFALAHIEIGAVAARDLSRAQAFADVHKIAKAYGSYDELVNDPEIDIIYVSTLNHVHKDHALLAINAGKHVLVEKPFAMNAEEAQVIADAAKAKGVMAMEAMWTRFLPSHRELQNVVESGVLGSIRLVNASHNQLLTHIERLQDPAVGGGAMLDLGIYPLSFSFRILGVPTRIQAAGTFTDRGVDELVTAVLEFASGANATISTSMSAAGATDAEIVGTKARVELEGPFYNNIAWKVIDPDGQVLQSYEPDGVGRGMQHQALHFMECLEAGLTESTLLSLDESVKIMRAMDSIRAQVAAAQK